MASEVLEKETVAVGAPAPAVAAGIRLSAASSIVMAIAMGLGAGYLDAAIIVLKKYTLNPEGYYRIARDFPWSVPVGHAALMAIAGLVVAVVAWLGRGRIPLRWGAWLLATLAIWGALLRLPIYGACSLAMAAGLGRLVADVIAADLAGARRMRFVPAALVGLLVVLVAATTGRRMFAESRAVAALPQPPRARNTLLIVWDTVRGDHVSLYGYHRENTPNLTRFSENGVSYTCALAPAPWTFPSHSSFFTGRWPFEVDAQWKSRLDTPDPTLAEYLAGRGYQTAGFAANTNCCTYESGLERGFLHYEDYSTDPLALLSRTVPGAWLVAKGLIQAGDYWRAKWAVLQSRDASAVNDAFLSWLDRRRTDRPFFAFLNFFDAHDSFLPPPRFEGRFGVRPRTPSEYAMLLDYVGIDKMKMEMRELVMARDSYDNCIAYLDDQLGRLIAELDRRGVLADTDVIVTSDHGEAFAEHGFVGHSYTAMMEELRVPLLIVSRGGPAGRMVFQPATLRDLPATVVDRLGLAEGSPFPGQSLAASWGKPPGTEAPGRATPGLSEQVNRQAWSDHRPEAGRGGPEPGFQMSLVALTHHYIRDGEGMERLFDLRTDPYEQRDVAASPDKAPILHSLRATMLEVLTESPGSTAVEDAYLRSFRESLRDLVAGDQNPEKIAADPRPRADREGR